MEKHANPPTLLGIVRKRFSQMILNYPTDPMNSGLIALALLTALIAGLSNAHWHTLAAALAAGLIGGLGIFAARSNRLVRHALQITIFGSTAVFVTYTLVLTSYPIWWISALPLGALASGGVLFYWGIRFSLLWYGFEAIIAAIAIFLASQATPHDPLLVQALLAGEILLFIVHAGIVLLLPQQSEAEARTTEVTQQSIELGNLAQQISATADGLGRAASAIHMVTGQQSSGAEQQAAVITEAVAMLNEFIALADEIRVQARGITQQSEQTAEVSERGQNALRLTTEGMSQIRSQVTVIASNIAGLAVQTQRIDEIITSVSEIATQSNLLALNASIEAARAGAHGRGFAVVADEVRTLAQQSQNAAAQVQSILTEIQDAMQQTVRATEVGDQQVDEGLELAQQAGGVIMQLADNVNESATAMRSIMAAIDQQSTGLEEITRSMRNLHDVTQKNLESNRTAEIVAENLTRLSEEMLHAIEQQTGHNLHFDTGIDQG